MVKKKSSKPKQSPLKKNCKGKCVNNNCELKSDAQKKCNNQLPELSSKEIVIHKSRSLYFLGLIRKIFGYE